LSDQKQPSAEQLIAIADALEPSLHQAGHEILRLYHAPEHVISTKSDASPVTTADLASHDLLVAALRRATPDWPVISEEDSVHHGFSKEQAGSLSPDAPWWLLDPLDGTKEFIARTGEFSINLGLVVNHRAVFGMLYGPLHKVLYRGGVGMPSERKSADSDWVRIRCRTRPADGGVLISSRRSVTFPEGETFTRRDHLGSALKFGRIAEGQADVYVRRGPTMEWDTCAGQAIVEAAGGQVLTLQRQPLRYGKPDFRNAGFLVSAQ